MMFSYTAGRTLIALSLFITLVFNNNNTIFPDFAFENYKTSEGIEALKNLNFFFLCGYENLLLSKLSVMLVLLVSIIGLFPKITGFFLFYFTNSFLNISTVVDGGDVISSNLSLMILPIVLMDDRQYLYDFSRNIFDTNYKKIIANNVFLFMQIQVSFLYLNGCIGKLFVKEWVEGTATYYFTDSSVYGFGLNKSILKEILNTDFMTIVMTWGTLTIEFLLFACLFISSYKKKFQMFIIGLGFHLLIIFLFGLVSFFFSMSACLVLYLTYKKERIIYETSA